MPTLTRDELKRNPSRLLSSGRNRTKADVSLIVMDSGGVVLKDFRGRGFIVRNTIGRFSVARECRALSRLAGVMGIPAFYGRIDAHALAWAFAEGRPLPELTARSLPPSFFDALDGLLAAIHERGVAVGDIHHRNVIVRDPGPGPALIDFSLAVTRPASRWNLPGRWIFDRLAEIDRVAVARIRRRYEAPAPEGAGAHDRGAGRSGELSPRIYRWGRGLKRFLRRLRGKQ